MVMVFWKSVDGENSHSIGHLGKRRSRCSVRVQMEVAVGLEMRYKKEEKCQGGHSMTAQRKVQKVV